MKRYEIEVRGKDKWHLDYGPFNCRNVAEEQYDGLRRVYPNETFRIVEIVETRTVIEGEKE